MKIHVLGHARHGKDTASDTIARYLNLTWYSSSIFAAKKAVYPALRDVYDYKSLEECYEDRVNHRPEWKRLIKEYNKDEPSRLSRELFGEYDIYCGIRDREEFLHGRELGLFQVAVWIDASKRLPPEDVSSCTVTIDDADIIITNNHSLIDFQLKIRRFCDAIRLYHV